MFLAAKLPFTNAERLYSIYYKLRRNRDGTAAVQNLICFMSAFYTEMEQTQAFPLLIEEMDQSTMVRDALDQVMTEYPGIVRKFLLIDAIDVAQRI